MECVPIPLDLLHASIWELAHRKYLERGDPSKKQNFEIFGWTLRLSHSNQTEFCELVPAQGLLLVLRALKSARCGEDPVMEMLRISDETVAIAASTVY